MLTAHASMKIHEHEISAKDILSPEAALKQAAAEAQVTNPIAAILSAWPNINSIVLRLANRFTHLYPAKGENVSLLALCLSEGVAAYRIAGDDSMQSRMMACAFIQALIESAAKFFAYDVHAVNEMGEGERWDATQAPLTEWVRARSSKRIVFSEKPEGDAADSQAVEMMLPGLLLSMSDMRFMSSILASSKQ